LNWYNFHHEDRDVTDELNQFMTELCQAGADAIRTYVTVSGEPYATMPEYFLGSSIFSVIGRKRAVTLETPLWQLHDWLRNSGPVPDIDPEVSRWKLDMIVYDGFGPTPHDQKAWALVEIKNGYIDADLLEGRRSDRAKLLSITNWFHASKPHIICCGSLNSERREFHIRQAEKLGDRWFEDATGQLPYDNGEAYFCARVIA
jgi:hypothetical protein